MDAPLNTWEHEDRPGIMPDRGDLRYRFARLLTEEHFEDALHEAQAAYNQRRITAEDLKFVVEIVEAARRIGRIRLEPIPSFGTP